MIAYGRDWLSGVRKLFDRRNRFWRSLSLLCLGVVTLYCAVGVVMLFMRDVYYSRPIELAWFAYTELAVLGIIVILCAVAYSRQRRGLPAFAFILAGFSLSYIVVYLSALANYKVYKRAEQFLSDQGLSFQYYLSMKLSTFLIIFALFIIPLWINGPTRNKKIENEFT